MVSRDHEQQWKAATPPRTATIARRISWLVVWGIVTVSVAVVVISDGFRDGGIGLGVAFAATAVGFFVLPDLTFIIGARDPHDHGRLPQRTVPYYNTMHRVWAPLALTALAGWLVVGSVVSSTMAVVALVGGLSWVAHVAIDRATGFGLRNPDGSL